MASVQVLPNIDTISLHVLPHMSSDTVNGVLRKLREADVPGSTVAISILIQNLDRQDLNAALDVVTGCK